MERPNKVQKEHIELSGAFPGTACLKIHTNLQGKLGMPSHVMVSIFSSFSICWLGFRIPRFFP